MPIQTNVAAAIDAAARLRKFAGDFGQVKKRVVGTLARRIPVITRRDIQDEYNLPASRINEGLVTRQTADAVEITGKKRGIGLVSYMARDTRRTGVVVTVQKEKGRQQFSDAFIASGRGGGRQVFVRETKARLPIKVLYGTSIASALRKPERQQRIADEAQEILRAEVDRLTKER